MTLLADDLELIRLFAEGNTVESIGRRMGFSERTVRRRMRALCDDVGVDSTIQLVVWAVRQGLV